MKPSNVGTGLVVGQFGLGAADGLDADKEPEVIPLQGTITFTPSIPYLPNPTAAPNPITIMTGPIVAVLDSEGYLCTPGPDGVTPHYRGIRLFATNDPDLSVLDWTWSVVYTFLPVKGITPKLPAHSMALLEDETRDLATVVPVPSSPGIGTPQALALLEQAIAAAGTVAEAQDLMNRAEEAANRAEAPTDAMMASTTANPASLFVGELAAVIDERAPDAVEAVMRPVVNGLVAQSIATDGTVATAAAAAVDANPKIAQLEAADWLKDVILTAGDSLDNYIGVPVGKQVKGRISTGAIAQGISGWPAGLAFQGAKFTSEGITSSVSLQTLQTHNITDPQLWIRSAVTGGGQAWKRVGDPAQPAGGLTAPALAATQDLFLLDSGASVAKTWFLAAIPSDWQAQHLPVNARGSVMQSPVGSSRIMTYLTWEATPRMFVVWRNGATWGAWSQIGSASSSQAPASGASSVASGMKVVGIPLSVGHFGSEGELEQTVRLPLRFEAPGFRFRVGFQHVNTRSGATRQSAVTVSDVRYGNDAGLGAFVPGTTASLGAVTVPADGTAVYTKWANISDWAGSDKLLGFGYTASAAPWAMLGHAYKTSKASDATIDAPAGLTKSGVVPCTIWLEVETYATTPVVASFGDSNSVGVGAARGVHDSWLSQLCRRIKAFPVHLGSSGDSCGLSQDGGGYKYTRFSGLARPDAVIMAMGQNDAAQTGSTFTAIKPLMDTVLRNLAANVSPNVYAVSYMPRTTDAWTGFEAVRREMNAYLETEPGPVRDVFDIGSAVGADDETILPAYDSDGIHLNADGFAQVQAAINRPVTSPPVMFAAV